MLVQQQPVCGVGKVALIGGAPQESDRFSSPALSLRACQARSP